ncbi:MAG: hypothetical protein V1737_03710 [Chloroflexota bacterium]
MEKQATCKERVRPHLNERMSDIRKLWAAYRKGNEHGVDDIGTFNEYGLCFDYVAPKTFRDQKRGYFRYQLSWGGPSEEFRFFCDENLDPVRIEFWFLDWGDGAKTVLSGRNHDLMAEIFQDFKDTGTVKYQYDQAMQH